MMSKITWLTFLVSSVLVSSLMAAVPTAGAWDAEMEILSLPLSNQKRLLKSDKKTLDRLVVVAQDTNLALDLRWKSIMALGFLEGQNPSASYLSLASSKEWFVKNGLLIALDENNHPKRFEIAKKLVKDPSLIVRSSAFDILMQESSNRDLLWEELFNAQNVKKKRSLWVRPKIISYMNQNPKSYERGLFEKLMKENEPEIVKLAEKGLKKINSMSAVQGAVAPSKTF
jgi:hypothetical protein